MADGLVFNWDAANIAHVARHNVTPEEVEQVFANDPMDLGAEVVEGEERYTSVGHTNRFRVLVLAWTMRGDATRAITAFDASERLIKTIPNEKGILIMLQKGKRIVVPKFKTEAEEAQWWYDNRDKVENALINAMDNGTIRRGTAQRLTSEARASRNVTIRMAEADLDLARRQAEKKGLPYQTYIKSVLHEALVKREAITGRTSRSSRQSSESSRERFRAETFPRRAEAARRSAQSEGLQVQYGFAGLLHVHHHQDPQIVVSRDRAVQQAENRQPHQVRLQRRLEDIELAEEAGGQRNADQREQEHRQQRGGHRLAHGEAREVVDADMLLALARRDASPPRMRRRSSWRTPPGRTWRPRFRCSDCDVTATST